jgi:glycosidase
VRNHDELTLDKLTKSERKEVFAAFGPDPDMQLFDRGLRRRLPTMLGGDDRRIRLVYSLMFSLPGTPTLFYGEEIGMGENLDVEGRLAVRTPMQWDDGPNGGFSTAPTRRLTRPQPTGLFGPDQVNAAAQRQDPDSLWSFVRLLIRRYRQMPQIGWSDLEVLDHDVPAVLAHVCRCDGWSLLAVHNLGAGDAIVALDLGPVAEGSVLRDVLGPRQDQPVDADGRVEVRVDGSSGAWLRVLAPGEQAYA